MSQRKINLRSIDLSPFMFLFQVNFPKIFLRQTKFTFISFCFVSLQTYEREFFEVSREKGMSKGILNETVLEIRVLFFLVQMLKNHKDSLKRVLFLVEMLKTQRP